MLLCATLAALQIPTVPGEATAPVGPSFGASVRLAVIGDYGLASPGEQAVASLVGGFGADLILTVGDNNYPDGAASTIDANIGQYYSRWISPYVGAYPRSKGPNRFFPSLGNHDWVTPGATPYLDYFSLPGNERYYELRAGPVHVFAVDSDGHEPSGNTAGSVQAAWLQAALAASSAPFKIVYFHHSPFSSAEHGNTYEMQWPFRAWGADLVLSGHDHDYERFQVDGFPYVVDGVGGNSLYTFRPLIVGGSEFRYALGMGAVSIEADAQLCTLRFVDTGDFVQDSIALRPTPADLTEIPLVAAGASWHYLDDGSNQGTAWRAALFDDTSWASGPAQLGYGDGDEVTVVNGGPVSNRFATTYFRHTFTVASVAALRGVRLELLRDDGAALFVNGTEVLRDNLAAGAGFAVFADSAATYDENAWHPYDLPTSVLVNGTNTIAVEVHQSSATSSDVSFDLRLTGIQEGTRLIARGSTWKYRDGGLVPGPSWMQPGFDDSAWISGPAQLGYGEGDEATTVSYGPDPQNKAITTWFRKSFTVANPAAFQALALALVHDDGARVFVNGSEALRFNLPRTSLSATSLAGRNLSAPEENAFHSTFIDPRLLVAGTNTIAVELHQVNGQSSDLSFDLELVGL